MASRTGNTIGDAIWQSRGRIFRWGDDIVKDGLIELFFVQADARSLYKQSRNVRTRGYSSIRSLARVGTPAELNLGNRKHFFAFDIQYQCGMCVLAYAVTAGCKHLYISLGYRAAGNQLGLFRTTALTFADDTGSQFSAALSWPAIAEFHTPKKETL